MENSTRNNYKAKWLAALKSDVETPSVSTAAVAKGLQTIRSIDSDTASAVNKIREAAIEAAVVARRVLELMDSEANVAGVDFGKVGVAIDSKLALMPVPIILRRLRDTLKIAEARIGILSVSANEYYTAHQKIVTEVDIVQSNQEHLQRALLETSYIGARPTTSDLEDYKDNKASDFTRFGLNYTDLPEDWLDLSLNHRNTTDHHDSETTDGSDDDADEPSNGQIVKRAPIHNQNGSRTINDLIL